MLLERERDLDVVAACIREAQKRRGGLLLVRGPLGVGKSALLDGIDDLCTDALTLRASAASMEHDFSFGVVRQLFEPPFRRAGAEEVEWWLAGPAGEAGAVLSDALTPQRAPEAVLRGLDALVGNMSQDRLVLILVDDLHWADAESLLWLRHLVTGLRSRRVLLVCTLLEGDVREEQPLVREIAAHARHTLVPAHLGVESSGALVRRVCDAVPDQEFVLACHRESRGNPLFLTCLLAEVTFRGLKPSAENTAAAVALRPSLLRQRLLLSLESQPEHVRRTAFAMTVLGESAELLGQLAGLDTVRREEAVRILISLGLVVDSARPRFVHPVVRDAVEEGMSPPERAALHVVAAVLLHRCGYPVEQVADHLMPVVTPQGPWAAEVLRSAADSALRGGAPRAAAKYLRRALLDTSPTGQDRARLLVDLGAAERSFATSAAMRHIAQAVPLLRSAREQAAALARLGPLTTTSVPLPIDETLHRVAAELAGQEPLDGAGHDLALRLEARMRTISAGNPAQVADAVRRLRDLGAEPSADTAAERELLAVLVYTATAANRLPSREAVGLAKRLLDHELPSPAHVHTTLPLAVAVLAAGDEVLDLGPWLDHAYQAAERRESTVEQVMIRTEQALVALACGRLGDARDRALDAYRISDEDNGASFTTMSAVTLATVALQCEDPELAELGLGHHRTGLEAQHVAALGAMMQGCRAARERDPQRALEHYLNAGHRLEQIGWHNPALLSWGSYAALMYHWLGDSTRAADVVLQEVDRAQSWGAPCTVGATLAVQGRVTPGRLGVELLEEAVELLETSANRFELCKALFALGKRQNSGDRRGNEALVRSHALAVECGAPWMAHRVRELLGETGRELRVTRTALTPTEYKVAQLAASGSSNQAIADRQNISTRAVEKHLTNCYRKLGIKGRADLASALSQCNAENIA